MAMLNELIHSNEKNLSIKVTVKFARFLVSKMESRLPPLLTKADEFDSWIDEFLYGPAVGRDDEGGEDEL